MPKRAYTKRVTAYDATIGGRYLDHSSSVEILISTVRDGNMDSRFSNDAQNNFQKFLEKHGISPQETFSPALGLNYGIITIDESNEQNFAGKYIEFGDPRKEYWCDAVIVFDSTVSVPFRVGDCPVVLIVGRNPRDKIAFSHIHAGRAELTAGMPKIAAAKMAADCHVHLPSSTAYIFPHICKQCYSLQYVDPATEEKAGDFLAFADGLYHLDLTGWVKQQLEEAGIGRVVMAYYRCTAGLSPVCDSRLLHDMRKFKGLFSNYRSFHCGSAEGRFIVAARILDQDLNEDY